MTQTDCPQFSFDYQDLGSRKVHANFHGGHLFSDGGGALFLHEVEKRCGFIKRFACCFDDRRNQEFIEHPVADLLAQRINGLILGYEDLNDHDDQDQVEAPARRFTKLRYRTKGSWSRERRVIARLELLPGKTNLRFIVTNLPGEGFDDERGLKRFQSQELYEDFYCARGEMENRIKEQQMDLFADRASTYWMKSNQLRLWFSVIAHLIMNRLKACVLKGTELENATIGQVRLKLFKIAVRIKVSVRRVLLEFASSYPRKNLFGQCVANLERLDQMPA